MNFSSKGARKWLPLLAVGAVVTTATTASAGAYTGANPGAASVAAPPVEQVQQNWRGGGQRYAPGPRAYVAPRGYVGPPRGYVGPPRGYGGPRYVGPPRAFYGGGPRWAHRPWYSRPYYGTIIGGIALGTIIAATAYGVAPAAAPRPDLCWYWADEDQSRGYWDYC